MAPNDPDLHPGELATDPRVRQFTYTVMHDLRAPLNTAVGLLHLLKDPTTQADSEDLIERSVCMVNHTRALVAGLLELASVAQHEVRWERFDATDAAVEAASALTRELSEAQGSLEIGLRGEFIGDRDLVVGMLRRLLSNAIAYRDERRALQISINNCTTATEFWISDNGPGIDEDARTRIFQPLDRGNRSKVVLGHLGLGLAWCHQVSLLHGGQIWVAPSEGGAMFKVRWPPPPPEQVVQRPFDSTSR